MKAIVLSTIKINNFHQFESDTFWAIKYLSPDCYVIKCTLENPDSFINIYNKVSMENNDNESIAPVVYYFNIDVNKKIIKENKGKSGIYRWNNLVTGKSYVGSSVNLVGILSIYY